jgi:hypothetical protein
MVGTWRSSSSAKVLLRISGCTAPITPRTVANTTASFASPPRSTTSPTSPRDEGDHDSDIDLITLRRRTLREKSHQPTSSSYVATGHVPDLPSRNPVAKSVGIVKPRIRHIDSPAQPQSQHARPSGHDTPLEIEPLSQLIKQSDPTTDASATTLTQKDIGVNLKPHPTNYSKLDPYLIKYLESLRPEPGSLPRRPVLEPQQPSQRDSDIDRLQPSDIRATYFTATNRESHLNQQPAVEDIQDGRFRGSNWMKDPRAYSGIEHLPPSIDNKVVIPRPVLVRLIEQTITLSGASVHGNDVVIERYSPTWHRFARLLRTSDLHKISTLGEQNRLKAKTPIKKDANQDNSRLLADDPMAADAVSPNTHRRSASESSNLMPEPFIEREYVILALDAKKKRVSLSRFRRLLDGSTEDTSPSAEALLKVESLDRYIIPMRNDAYT